MGFAPGLATAFAAGFLAGAPFAAGLAAPLAGVLLAAPAAGFFGGIVKVKVQVTAQKSPIYREKLCKQLYDLLLSAIFKHYNPVPRNTNTVDPDWSKIHNLTCRGLVLYPR